MPNGVVCGWPRLLMLAMLVIKLDRGSTRSAAKPGPAAAGRLVLSKPGPREPRPPHASPRDLKLSHPRRGARLSAQGRMGEGLTPRSPPFCRPRRLRRRTVDEAAGEIYDGHNGRAVRQDPRLSDSLPMHRRNCTTYDAGGRHRRRLRLVARTRPTGEQLGAAPTSRRPACEVVTR